jgi:hypothetical protein
MRGLRKTRRQKYLKRGGDRGKVFDPIMVEEVDTDVFLNGTPNEPLDDGDRNDRVVVFLDDTRSSGMGLFRSRLRNPSLDQMYGNAYRENIVGDENNSFLTLSVGDINTTVSLRDYNLIINSPLRHFILTKTTRTTKKLFSYTLMYAHFQTLQERPEWIEYVRNNPTEARASAVSGAHGQEGTDREIYSVTPLTQNQYTETIPNLQNPVTPPVTPQVQRENSSEILARQLQEEENLNSDEILAMQLQEEELSDQPPQAVPEYRQRPKKISAKQSDYIRYRTQRQADLNRHLDESSRSRRDKILKQRREYSPQNPIWTNQVWGNELTQYYAAQKEAAERARKPQEVAQRARIQPIIPLRQRADEMLRRQKAYQSQFPQRDNNPPTWLGGQTHSISSIRGHRLPSLPTRRVRRSSSSKKRRYTRRRLA